VEKEITSDTVTEAPSFYQIANLDQQTMTKVKLFLTQPVHPMPNLSLAREEIEDLATYIMSLREPPAGVSGD
jgi:cytochrome c1